MNEEVTILTEQNPLKEPISESYPDEYVPAESEEKSEDITEIDNTEDDSSKSNIDTLKAEILELREMIQSQRKEVSRKIREIEEFNRLFPNVSLSELPDTVSAMVNEGVPLTAAYALYEKELASKIERAQEINKKNASLSAGKAGIQTTGEFFTPDEVRSMSPRQVHENYSKIRESMKHWRNKTFY